MFPCFSCTKIFQCGKSLVSHVQFFHSNTVAFSCKYNNCSRTFDRLRSFSRHLASHTSSGEPHPKRSKNSSSHEPLQGDIQIPISSDRDKENDSSNVDPLFQVDNDENVGPAEFEKAVTESALIFVAKLYSIDTLTRGHVQMIVDNLRDQLSGGFLEMLEKKVFEALALVDSPLSKEIKVMFRSLKGMFDGLESEHKRMQVFQQCGAYIPPEAYVIGPNLDEGSLMPKDLTGQYISVGKVLKGFLELPSVLSSITEYMEKLENSCSDLMENFVQGKLWREEIKPRFAGKFTLPIGVYGDDFETCEALGSHSGVYKISGIYYNILCIPPEFRSSLDNIFTALLYHAQDQSFGNSETLRPLLEELKSLEEDGIVLVVDGKEVQVHFAVCVILGDNLGVHTLQGFTECFRANFPCRACKIPRDAAQSQTSLDRSLLRNKHNYDIDVALNDVSKTGIKEECVWNELKSFHCIENQVFDIMHDLDEGVWDWDLCCLLDVLIYERKRFSLEELNDRVQGFDYGSSEVGNKPPVISRDHIKRRKLHCSASERKCLLRYLGLMIGDLVRVDDDDYDVWNFYNIAHSILDFHSSPTVSAHDCALLKDLVEEHNSLFLETFPGQKLRPKNHHLLHHPEVIPLVGPLKDLSCYSFENNHKPSKQYANVICNHINVPYSLAVKTQLKLCYRFLSRIGFNSKFEVSSGDWVSVALMENCDSFSYLLPSDITSLYCVRWVQIFGTRYTKDMVIVPKLDTEHPVFGQIKYISFSEPTNIAFVLRLYQTVCHNKYFQAYEVEEASEWWYVEREQLVSFLPTHVRRGPDGKMYVTFRHKF